ncbi:MAG: hypothetical protein WA948_07355 [Pontixanthobacter sp.]
MTRIYITIDTEYSAGMAAAGRAENYNRSIACFTRGGGVGIHYQMDVLDRHGLKGVFFVDPMPALLWGTAAIADIVRPIVARGHDVQLHCHAEWLQIAGPANPFPGKTAGNIGELSFDDQCRVIAFARETLVAAGAPPPVAFRAGNYGANDDTLRALALLGMRYDTSHAPGIANSPCNITLTDADCAPVAHRGIVEVPIGCVTTFGGRRRHAQITAVTSWEMLAGLRHARDIAAASFTVVSHSFELLSRDRRRINRIITGRFEHFCNGIARMAGVDSATYTDHPPVAETSTRVDAAMPASQIRSGYRLAEQAVSNLLYGSR